MTLTVDYWIDVSCSLRNYTRQTHVRPPGAVSVLGQRHRRWASIESALGRRLVSARPVPTHSTILSSLWIDDNVVKWVKWVNGMNFNCLSSSFMYHFISIIL